MRHLLLPTQLGDARGLVHGAGAGGPNKLGTGQWPMIPGAGGEVGHIRSTLGKNFILGGYPTWNIAEPISPAYIRPACYCPRLDTLASLGTIVPSLTGR